MGRAGLATAPIVSTSALYAPLGAPLFSAQEITPRALEREGRKNGALVDPRFESSVINVERKLKNMRLLPPEIWDAALWKAQFTFQTGRLISKLSYLTESDRLSPLDVVRDLRSFLGTQKPHEELGLPTITAREGLDKVKTFVRQWLRACLAQIRVATWDEDKFWCQALISEGLATYDAILKSRPPDPGGTDSSPGELSPEEEDDGAQGTPASSTQPKLVDPTSMGKLQQYYGRSKRRVAHFSLDPDHADESTSSAAAADLRGATSAEVEAAREAQARDHRAKEAARETRFGAGPSLDRIRLAELDVEKALREVQERIRRQKRLCSDLEDVDNPDPKLVNMRVRAG